MEHAGKYDIIANISTLCTAGDQSSGFAVESVSLQAFQPTPKCISYPRGTHTCTALCYRGDTLPCCQHLAPPQTAPRSLWESIFVRLPHKNDNVHPETFTRSDACEETMWILSQRASFSLPHRLWLCAIPHVAYRGHTSPKGCSALFHLGCNGR